MKQQQQQTQLKPKLPGATLHYISAPFPIKSTQKIKNKNKKTAA